MPWMEVRERVRWVESILFVVCFVFLLAFGVIQLQFHGAEKRVKEMGWKSGVTDQEMYARNVRLSELEKAFRKHTHRYHDGKIK